MEESVFRDTMEGSMSSSVVKECQGSKVDREVFQGVHGHTKVMSEDKLGPGGAYHLYYILGAENGLLGVVNFQKGAVKEVGINGVANEDLISIVMDRLEKFQEGPFSCDANKYALWYLQGAMTTLEDRTKERRDRGVEGKEKA